MTFSRAALLVLAAASLRAQATRTGLQDARYQAPADIYTGPISFFGQVKAPPAGATGFEFKLESAWGEFTYRVRRAGGEAGQFGRPDDVLPRRQPGVQSREIGWTQLAAGPLWLDGEIDACRNHGSILRGRFAFAGEIADLELELTASRSAGPTPPPTYRNLNYGPHFRQMVDVYLAKARASTPVAVYIHGGGWTGRDKSEIHQYQSFLDAGISVVSVNYRLCPVANPDADTPAVAIPLHDAARAIQFIRSHAAEWRVLPDRLGIWGESAGTCSALWLATHSDMANPAATDPVTRLSTRPECVAALIPQTSLDPLQMREWVGPELTYGPHAFGIASDGNGAARFQRFLAAREQLLPWIREYSPAALLTRDGPPLFLDYGERSLQPRDKDAGYYTHSPRFGIGFNELAQMAGRECYLKYNGLEPARYFNWTAFMIARLAE